MNVDEINVDQLPRRSRFWATNARFLEYFFLSVKLDRLRSIFSKRGVVLLLILADFFGYKSKERRLHSTGTSSSRSSASGLRL